jgi:hypothetical protein
MGDVFTGGTVATFAANVPFPDLLAMDVVVNGVASITSRVCRSLHVVRRIEGCPPVGACIRDVILEPLLVVDVPLHGQRIVVVAYLREVALLPDTAVDKGHLLLRELRDVVRAEIWDDRVRVLSRIAHHVPSASSSNVRRCPHGISGTLASQCSAPTPTSSSR